MIYGPFRIRISLIIHYFPNNRSKPVASSVWIFCESRKRGHAVRVLSERGTEPALSGEAAGSRPSLVSKASLAFPEPLSADTAKPRPGPTTGSQGPGPWPSPQSPCKVGDANARGGCREELGGPQGGSIPQYYTWLDFIIKEAFLRKLPPHPTDPAILISSKLLTSKWLVVFISKDNF